ncbi:MAG: SLBB domain-containing protein [Pseudonocardia sp.]|uniref:NADH-ubiquinone oxidoreductase-F iron-sulfur binding region domain-containing protein n=1 Tax=Pseudonocardia sp. TaxID=60912 RepID=UPI001AD10FBE|nr:NADH-ubiquinone oxidoreductase-F iron-sulfur binding region domain-containing protein [Pseudonocardia sp.]MBN9098502.1 SLBB domain-containing protein [Pseudonocardia sp.]
MTATLDPPVRTSPLLDATRPPLRPVPLRGAAVIAEVAAAGLTGRGGAGFPVARKLAAVNAAVTVTGRTPVVVGNGSEGEPASSKDRVLLTTAPHLVLDGLAVAADAVGADRAHLVVTPAAVAAVRAAVAQRSDRVPVDVVAAGEHFVSGEETAVVAGLEGRRAVPGDKFRRVVESGVHGRPTLVQNVETLAHLGLIARSGAAWFRSRGTAAEPGTALVTISGAVARPGVFEVDHGAPLRDVVGLAGPRGETPVLVGGFHGAWLAPHEVAGAAFCRASLGTFGASPGAGVLIVLPAGASGLAETARITAYLAGQSAGQCGPCVNGLPRLAAELGRVAAGHGSRPDDRAELYRLAGLTEGRGACHHPDGTVRLVGSALRVFGARS